jgi:hypothetical protein
MSFALAVIMLSVGLLLTAGCQTSRSAPPEADIDTELTTYPSAPVSPPAIPREPRPGFDQDPQQAP